MIGSVPVDWVELSVSKIDPDPDDESSHLDVCLLVATPFPRQAMVVTMTCPVKRQIELGRLWQEILRGSHFRYDSPLHTCFP
jgi:hypothetical protein